jgi:hypothetical protein
MLLALSKDFGIFFFLLQSGCSGHQPNILLSAQEHTYVPLTCLSKSVPSFIQSISWALASPIHNLERLLRVSGNPVHCDVSLKKTNSMSKFLSHLLVTGDVTSANRNLGGHRNRLANGFSLPMNMSFFFWYPVRSGWCVSYIFVKQELRSWTCVNSDSCMILSVLVELIM